MVRLIAVRDYRAVRYHRAVRCYRAVRYYRAERVAKSVGNAISLLSLGAGS